MNNLCTEYISLHQAIYTYIHNKKTYNTLILHMVKAAFTNFSVRLCDMSELFFLNYIEFVSSIQILSPRLYCGPWKYLSITSYGQYD